MRELRITSLEAGILENSTEKPRRAKILFCYANTFMYALTILVFSLSYCLSDFLSFSKNILPEATLLLRQKTNSFLFTGVHTGIKKEIQRDVLGGKSCIGSPEYVNLGHSTHLFCNVPPYCEFNKHVEREGIAHGGLTPSISMYSVSGPARPSSNIPGENARHKPRRWLITSTLGGEDATSCTIPG